ncbi:hypothetical protein ACFU0X_10360 [Streptomyces cellulosae]|uniref:Uncharacterized protein n=1 Tax=Streptomyces cellulosae TaxID=1968 RepID=A0ABW6JGG6_STRCE
MTTIPEPTSLEREVTEFLRAELARQGVPNPQDYRVVWEWARIPGLPERVADADREELARRFAEALDLPLELVSPTAAESGKPGDRA